MRQQNPLRVTYVLFAIVLIGAGLAGLTLYQSLESGPAGIEVYYCRIVIFGLSYISIAGGLGTAFVQLYMFYKHIFKK